MIKYVSAICKECGKPVINGDGKVDKKGMWTCTDCLIDKDKQ
jgi:hypothetical protein